MPWISPAVRDIKAERAIYCHTPRRQGLLTGGEKIGGDGTVLIIVETRHEAAQCRAAVLVDLSPCQPFCAGRAIGPAKRTASVGDCGLGGTDGADGLLDPAEVGNERRRYRFFLLKTDA
jgi:hypothetical protein